MAGKVDRIAVGFLDPKTGNIRSKQELSKLDSQAQAKSAGKASETQIITDVQNPLAAVRSKVNEQGNRIISDVNKQIDKVDAAQANIKAQITAAKDLKTLIKQDGSSEEISAKKAELSELQKQSQKLKSEIDSQNKEIDPSQVRSIRVGNKTEGTFSVAAVEFEASQDPTEVSTAKDAQALIDSLSEQRDSLKEQKISFKETRQDVKDALAGAREELKGLQDKVVQSFDQAKGLANNIAEAIRSGGLATVEANSLNKVSARVLLG